MALHNVGLALQFIRVLMIVCVIASISCVQTAFCEDDLTNIINNIQDEPSNDEEALEQSEEPLLQPKILRLEILSDIDSISTQPLYVGQYLTISYRVMLFDNARVVYTEFSPSLESASKEKEKGKKATQSVALVHSSEWQQEGEYLRIDYTFKILKSNVVIPSLVVHVQNNNIQDSMQTDSISLLAQDLSSSPLYSNVVASQLKVIDYTLEEFDDKNNMVLIEIEGKNSNLEDFTLKHALEQEFGQGSKFGNDIARANVLALVPKSLDSIEFTYFNEQKKDFEHISIPNKVNVAANDEYVKEDLSPKNSFLGVLNILLFFLLTLSIILTLVKRSYFFACLSILLLAFLAYRFFSNTYTIKTKPNATMLILPTKSSTELLTIANPVKLQAIDKKNGFYKVNINSTKIGWIHKDQVK